MLQKLINMQSIANEFKAKLVTFHVMVMRFKDVNMENVITSIDASTIKTKIDDELIEHAIHPGDTQNDVGNNLHDATEHPTIQQIAETGEPRVQSNHRHLVKLIHKVLVL